MKLLADSGSTTTNWALLDEGQEPTLFSSEGINPIHMDADEIYTILHKAFMDIDQGKVSEVWFYGAGIVGQPQKIIIKNNLAKFFPRAELFVESDLVAAAHAGLEIKEGSFVYWGQDQTLPFLMDMK